MDTKTVNITEEQFMSFMKNAGEKVDSTKALTLNFEKMIDSRDENATFPDYDGIYMAFIDNCFSPRVIYIGKSEGAGGVGSRIKDHIRDDHKEWLKKVGVRKNEEAHISYATTQYSGDDLLRVEAALIAANRPQFNKDNHDYYKPDKITADIICSGYGSLLKINCVNTGELFKISQKIKNTKQS